jgi:hypothetical protein
MPHTESLPCPLSDKDLAKKADELAQTIAIIEGEEDQKADDACRHRDILKALRETERRLARVLRIRTEDRDVEVEEIADYEHGRFYTRRLDTGETIHARDMTDSERQQPLDLQLTTAEKGVAPAGDDEL